MIDRRPAAIVQCRDAFDVSAHPFARATASTIAVRGGGHNAGGLGVWDDALVVDLSPMRSVRVDPARGTVRVEGGATWADVDHATVGFGLATPCGFLASTGVGGLTLGGGVGYLTRRYGMTIDNLVEADVVLADGTLVTASESEHPDLFWGLRGGGGNFGAVTSFEFRCHPVGESGVIIGGPVLYDLADTAEVMRWYRELLPTLPEELSGWIGLLTIPPAPPFPEELWGRKACGIVWCYTGPHDRADEALQTVRELRQPADRRPPADAVQHAPVPPSTRSTRRGCSGTGGPTSSRRSATRRSPCTSSTARSCRAVTRRCTSTRSTGRPNGWPRTRPPSPTGPAAGSA